MDDLEEAARQLKKQLRLRMEPGHDLTVAAGKIDEAVFLANEAQSDANPAGE